MDKAGVAVGLATISVVLAAVVYTAESAKTDAVHWNLLRLFARRWRRFDGSSDRRSASDACRYRSDAAGDEVKRM